MSAVYGFGCGCHEIGGEVETTQYFVGGEAQGQNGRRQVGDRFIIDERSDVVIRIRAVLCGWISENYELHWNLFEPGDRDVNEPRSVPVDVDRIAVVAAIYIIRDQQATRAGELRMYVGVVNDEMFL